MATIDNLPIPDFSTMSDEELLARIKDIRARRRDTTSEAHKEAVKKATSKSKKGKATALRSVESMIQDISPDDAEKLLAKLRAAKGGLRK